MYLLRWGAHTDSKIHRSLAMNLSGLNPTIIKRQCQGKPQARKGASLYRMKFWFGCFPFGTMR